MGKDLTDANEQLNAAARELAAAIKKFQMAAKQAGGSFGDIKIIATGAAWSQLMFAVNPPLVKGGEFMIDNLKVEYGEWPTQQ